MRTLAELIKWDDCSGELCDGCPYRDFTFGMPRCGITNVLMIPTDIEFQARVRTDYLRSLMAKIYE